MPDAASILRGLSEIANRFLPLAVAFHLALLIAFIVLVRGYRPSRRAACIALAMPLASVSALAFATGNPFNGTTFIALTGVVLALGVRMPNAPIGPTPRWAQIAGSLALAYAWLYPHFLDSHSAAIYLVAAPVGLLPCPTLSMVLGFGLLAERFDSRVFAFVTAGAGLFYAVFGIVRLGVWLDAGLLGSAAAMLVLHFSRVR